MAVIENRLAKDSFKHCEKCNDPKPLRRALHILRFPSPTALAEHLRSQPTGEGDEKSGWLTSRERFWHFVHRYYGNKVDATGIPIPAWISWLRAQGNEVVETEHGWRIFRRAERD